MALKRKIAKADYDKLSDVLKEEYTEHGDHYLLDVEGIDDADELRRARDREKREKKEVEKQLKEATDKLAEFEGSEDRRGKDVRQLDEAWKTKMDEATKSHNDKLSTRDQFIRKQIINNTAERIAREISTVPTIMSKAIAERLSVDFEGDEPSLKILGSDGKPSSLTIEQLTKEFVGNKEYSAIITGSKARGGGAPRDGNGKPGGAEGSGSDKPVDLSKLSPKDLATRLKAQRESQTA